MHILPIATVPKTLFYIALFKGKSNLKFLKFNMTPYFLEHSVHCITKTFTDQRSQSIDQIKRTIIRGVGNKSQKHHRWNARLVTKATSFRKLIAKVASESEQRWLLAI